MDHVDPSELISTYLDGEVTPPERAEAERLLESSPELRTQLDDFARLSDLIRGLPREDAPPELAAAIRRQAEQKALLASEPAIPHRSWRRELFALVGGAAVTVAGMAILVPMLEHDRAISPEVQLMTGAARRAGEPNADMAESPGGTSLAIKEADYVGDHATETAAAMSSRKERIGVAAPPSIARMSIPAEQAKDQQNALGIASAAAAPYGVTSGETVDTALVQVGDMLEIASGMSDGVVAVVVLTVVDVEEVGGQFEVLLSNNGLQVIPKDGETPDANGDESNKENRAPVAKKPRENSDSHHLTLVYVDAPRDAMKKVLEEMVQQHLFSRATLKPPVPASSIATVEGIDRENKEQEQQLALKNVEQAVEVGRNYAVQNVPEAQDRLGKQIAGRLGERRQAASNFSRSRQMEQSLRKMDDGKAKTEANAKRSVNEAAEDQPANALAALVSPRSQTNHSVVLMELDTKTGLVANNSAVARQALSSAKSQLEAKKGSTEELARPAAETRPDDNSADGDSDLVEETPVPQSVRVLFVLQQAASAP